MARKNKKGKKKLDSAAAIRGIEREEHFAEGRPLSGKGGWRAVRSVAKDRKREADRSACRGRHTSD
jgi:hypothetical protein